MNSDRQPKQLSAAFFQKIKKITEIGQEQGCASWNSSNDGITIYDEQSLDELLLQYYNFHLRTFKKMLLMYDFRKRVTESSEIFSHYCIIDRKLNQNASPTNYSKQPRNQDLSIEQKLMKQDMIGSRLQQLTKNIRATTTKSEVLSGSIKQRCKLNDRIIDSLVFKLMTRKVGQPLDKLHLMTQINIMKDVLKKNQDDLKSNIGLLQQNMKDEQLICSFLRDDKAGGVKQQPLHYLTEPEIRNQDQD